MVDHRSWRHNITPVYCIRLRKKGLFGIIMITNFCRARISSSIVPSPHKILPSRWHPLSMRMYLNKSSTIAIPEPIHNSWGIADLLEHIHYHIRHPRPPSPPSICLPTISDVLPRLRHLVKFTQKGRLLIQPCVGQFTLESGSAICKVGVSGVHFIMCGTYHVTGFIADNLVKPPLLSTLTARI